MSLQGKIDEISKLRPIYTHRQFMDRHNIKALNDFVVVLADDGYHIQNKDGKVLFFIPSSGNHLELDELVFLFDMATIGHNTVRETLNESTLLS